MALNFVRNILQGRTLGRALFNRAVAEHARQLSGRVLDLAGGSGSYRALLPDTIELVVTDAHPQEGATLVDFTKPLPFEDGMFDHVLFFNALYIAEDPLAVMREIRRVLKPHGSALVASPFMQNEMREPHDYRRLTSEGLETLFFQAGFTHCTLHSYGERFSVGANLLHSVFYFSLLRLPVYTLASAFDHMIPARVRRTHPAPIGYFCILKP